MKIKPINLKMMTFLIILMVIPMLFVGIYDYQVSQKKYLKDVEERLQSETQNWKFLASTLAEISPTASTIEKTKELISQQVIGKSGYIWVVDSDGVYQVSKNRLRDGENINNAKDADGVLFIQEAIQKAKTNPNGGEFQIYPWQNKGENSPRMKAAGLSYVPEWDWIIGASAYYDDFETDVLDPKEILIVLIATVFLGLIVIPIIVNKK